MQNRQYLEILESIRIYGKRSVAGYLCKCICGNTKEVRVSDFKRSKVVSCGCMSLILRKQKLIKEIPKNTKFGLLTVIKRLEEKSTEGYKYLCKCDCGKSHSVYMNRLKRGETKSCGCSSSKLNSLNNGGTGVPYETKKLQRAIRLCTKYRNFVKEALKRANGQSELSGEISNKLEVHHKESVSVIIKKYNLTNSNFLDCPILFSQENSIVLTYKEHKNFHREYGLAVTSDDWNCFILSQKNI